MREIHDRAFKEWAVACEAMIAGRQTILLRNGGIREENGTFQMNDREFFLIPTYDHQSPKLLKEPFVSDLARIVNAGYDAKNLLISAYAAVDTVAVVEDEHRLRELRHEHIWNDDYVRMRLDFNPYDPLYVVLLRVYRLGEPVSIPMRPEYGGCKSWVTLEQPLSTASAIAAIPDEEYARRRAAVLGIISPASVLC